MNLDGTGRRLVARGGREPCWSADGRGIVYVKSEFEKFTAMDFATKGLFVYDLSLGMGDLDFSGPEPRVVNVRNAITSEKPIKVQHVDWSPDGKYLAFSRGPYQNRGLGLSPALVGLPAPGWDICVADASTTNRWVAITTDGKSNKEPDWIPFR
jgi:hypothetical protein